MIIRHKHVIEMVFKTPKVLSVLHDAVTGMSNDNGKNNCDLRVRTSYPSSSIMPCSRHYMYKMEGCLFCSLCLLCCSCCYNTLQKQNWNWNHTEAQNENQADSNPSFLLFCSRILSLTESNMHP